VEDVLYSSGSTPIVARHGFRAVDDLGANEINARYFAGRSDGLQVGEAGRIAKAVV